MSYYGGIFFYYGGIFFYYEGVVIMGALLLWGLYGGFCEKVCEKWRRSGVGDLVRWME